MSVCSATARTCTQARRSGCPASVPTVIRYSNPFMPTQIRSQGSTRSVLSVVAMSRGYAAYTSKGGTFKREQRGSSDNPVHRAFNPTCLLQHNPRLRRPKVVLRHGVSSKAADQTRTTPPACRATLMDVRSRFWPEALPAAFESHRALRPAAAMLPCSLL